MRPDLEQLIALQALADSRDAADQRLRSLPSDEAALAARIDATEQAVARAREKLDSHQSGRRELEKDLSAVQGRLSRFKDQLMAVKTNKEYQAMQHEIAGAEQDVRAYEDRILEALLEADTLTAELAAAERARDEERSAVEAAQREIVQERARLEAALRADTDAYTTLAATVDVEARELFERIGRQRRGAAVVEARQGHCTYCHVRLRPQVYNDVMRNDMLIQCDSCQRLLYYAAPASAGS